MLYKALGFLVWRLAKRYLRRRAPSGRSLIAGGAGIGVLALAAVLALRRGDNPLR